MAERNQADVQGQGQGGPGDEEVLMELLRRLARGREEPKQEAGPRRMTRADRTQRINERRRAANAWGMSPAKRKYLQEQAEKRYQRRAEQKEEIRKRNLAKRAKREGRGKGVEMGPPAPMPGPVGPGAGVPRPEPSRGAVQGVVRGVAQEMGPERAMPGPSQFEGGGLGVEAGVMGPQRVQPGPVGGGGVTDEMLRERIQARARGGQVPPMTPEMVRRQEQSLLSPVGAEAAVREAEREAVDRRRQVYGGYEQMVGRRFQQFRHGGRDEGQRGLIGQGSMGLPGSAPRGGETPERRVAFREMLDEMGLEVVPKRAGLENLSLLERVKARRQGMTPRMAGYLDRLGRERQEDLAFENLMEAVQGGELNPQVLQGPSFEEAMRIVEGRQGPLSWNEMGPPAPLRGAYAR